MNKVTLVGHVGKDPEISEKFINFSVATTESWIDKQSGERKEITDWTRVSVNNPYVVKCISGTIKKGCKVYVDGSIKTRSWEDDQKVKHYITEVVVNYSGEVIVSMPAPKSDE
ncbi:single-stranded DNA-binding protein [Zophobihabitans entericus]|uniref:Single-stranded DNA-binding protein n=1 Tax=Zophobihabitans entericus TaxID=1635327 RepID=A0A6G9IFB9_9GAMM|nr:single-stranded DNA-binding protein [Zophobihabitans entericus]QIQ22512.1 single-stranded DNA-binding protein [Zophobihabitans entericus]